MQYASDKLAFAVGVAKKPLSYHGHEVQVIFLLGVPENIDEDDSILIRVYDEIISVAKDERLLHDIVQAKTFQELLGTLYK